jgi:hypothetical protein
MVLVGPAVGGVLAAHDHDGVRLARDLGRSTQRGDRRRHRLEAEVVDLRGLRTGLGGSVEVVARAGDVDGTRSHAIGLAEAKSWQ